MKSLVAVALLSLIGDGIALWWTFHGRRMEKDNARKLDLLLTLLQQKGARS